MILKDVESLSDCNWVTYADCGVLKQAYGFTPKIEIHRGLKKFEEWYKAFYLKSRPPVKRVARSKAVSL